MLTWFKLYHDLPNNIGLRRFTPQEKWAWVVLLCLASSSKERGVILAQDADVADYCEFPTTQDWLYYRDKLIAKGLVEINPSGNLQICNWEERQAQRPSDKPEAVRARVSKHRARKKAEAVTTGNALQRVSNEAVTRQIRVDLEKDLDPDSEKESKKNITSGDTQTRVSPSETPCESGTFSPVENFWDSEPTEPLKQAKLVEPAEAPVTPKASSRSTGAEPTEPVVEVLPATDEQVFQPPLLEPDLVGEEKSSGRRKSSKKEKNPSFWDALMDRYNEHKPDFWAKCESFGPERRRAVTALRKVYGDEELLLRVEQALQWATTSDYWAAQQASFHCLLAKSHIENWSESWRSGRHGKLRGPGDFKLMNTYKLISSYFDDMEEVQND